MAIGRCLSSFEFLPQRMPLLREMSGTAARGAWLNDEEESAIRAALVAAVGFLAAGGNVAIVVADLGALAWNRLGLALNLQPGVDAVVEVAAAILDLDADGSAELEGLAVAQAGSDGIRLRTRWGRGQH